MTEIREQPEKPLPQWLDRLERTHLWMVGVGVDEAGRPFGPGLDLGECECPDDCRRDHENE